MNFEQKIWANKNIYAFLLWPFSILFGIIVTIRRLLYRFEWLPVYRAHVPVIVVGNITVGGTGKTPFVLALVELLQSMGKRPAIVSRGYKAKQSEYPHLVAAIDNATRVGDEPKLLYERCSAPVVIDPNRSRAVEYLDDHNLCNVVVADDGLQHYALARDMEIIVMDAVRGHGNGFLLPAGPLRESKRRMKSADIVVRNGVMTGHGFTLIPKRWVNLTDVTRTLPVLEFKGKQVMALAGIGHPESFFDLITNLGIIAEKKAFPDHYDYTALDLPKLDPNIPLLMTEKDAVKCRRFAPENAWYLEVEAEFSPHLSEILHQKLEKIFEEYRG